jgi:RNA exonuclease NGL2
VDRTEKLFPVLQRAGYSYVYKTGHKKKHGSLIAFRKEMFEKVEDRTLYYDEQEVRLNGEAATRRGSSFFTKNIANLVALRKLDKDDQGFIVATTHLFWHPK